MDTPLLVALIGGGFSVVVALIHKLGKENQEDHGIVHRALGRIEQKIDSHIEDHGGQP
jgi:hypothetical protein